MDELHADLTALAFLIGEWEGEGAGSYPTVADFAYREVARYTAPPGKPFIEYRQRTWRAGEHPDAGKPLHVELGYIRPSGPEAAELVIVQPTGIVEILDGLVEGTSVAFTSSTVQRTRTAKEVVTTERNLAVSGDRLTYRLSMAAVGQEHQLHLSASLRRVR